MVKFKTEVTVPDENNLNKIQLKNYKWLDRALEETELEIS